MATIERLKDLSNQRKADASRDYQDYLTRLESLNDEENARLLDCLQLLGRSIEQVSEDGAMLQTARTLHTLAADLPRILERERELHQRQNAIDLAKKAADAKAYDEWEAAHKALRVEFSADINGGVTGRQAKHALSVLEPQLNRIFGDINWTL